MSLFAAFVQDNFAIVGVDSEGISVDGSRRIDMVKLFPLHFAGLLAFQAGALFASTLLLAGQVAASSDLDEIVGDMPRRLRAASTELERFLRGAGADDRLISAHRREGVALVGWSKTQRKMIGRAWIIDGDVISWEIAPFYASPWYDSLIELPEPNSPAAMRAVIEAQARLVHEREPHLAAGGRCLVATVSPDRVTILQMGMLPARVAPAAPRRPDIPQMAGG